MVSVTTNTPRNVGRRSDPLSKERIVEKAVEILETDGESALTFRALALRLNTGPGAIYWHVANKDELLEAATGDVIARATTDVVGGAEPREALRIIALKVFDAIDAHPWVGAQLARSPWQSAVMELFERFGALLQAVGVPHRAQFDSASALVHFILGLAGQYAAGVRLLESGGDRLGLLAAVAKGWAGRDRAEYPFLHEMTAQLRVHDDRKQFLAGIDLIIAGIETLQ